VQRPDGALRWLEARGKVLVDAQGNPRRMIGMVWDVTRRKRSEDNLLKIAQGVGGLTGTELMRSIVATLANVVEADFAMLGRRVDGHFIQTLAVFENGRLGENRRYDLANTPCSEVMTGSACVHAMNVQELFPNDRMLVRMGIEGYVGVPLGDSSGQTAGLLSALFRRPLARPNEVRSVLSILAAAASADLERSAVHQALRQANAELEERVRERTDELQRLVNLMAGREIRMAELKSELRTFRGEPRPPMDPAN